MSPQFFLNGGPSKESNRMKRLLGTFFNKMTTWTWSLHLSASSNKQRFELLRSELQIAIDKEMIAVISSGPKPPQRTPTTSFLPEQTARILLPRCSLLRLFKTLQLEERLHLAEFDVQLSQFQFGTCVNLRSASLMSNCVWQSSMFNHRNFNSEFVSNFARATVRQRKHKATARQRKHEARNLTTPPRERESEREREDFKPTRSATLRQKEQD